MTLHSTAIFGIREVKLFELLRANFPDLEKQAKGQWLLAMQDKSWPKPEDTALLIDEDLYAEDDVSKLDHEGREYAVKLGLSSVADIINFHLRATMRDDDQDRLKALLYYIGCDAFFDGSPASEANWTELIKNHRENSK